MKKSRTVFLQCSLICVLPVFFADAEEVRPTGKQISMKWGRVSENDGVRKVVSTEGEYNAHNRHGPITFYDVPFTNGTFSLSWKRDLSQKINLVFETEEDGKATHLFKVFVNGTPNKDHSKTDVISLVTYESIASSKKKRQLSGQRSITPKLESGIRQALLLIIMSRLFVSMIKHIQSRMIGFGRKSSSAVSVTYGERLKRKTWLLRRTEILEGPRVVKRRHVHVTIVKR